MLNCCICSADALYCRRWKKQVKQNKPIFISLQHICCLTQDVAQFSVHTKHRPTPLCVIVFPATALTLTKDVCWQRQRYHQLYPWRKKPSLSQHQITAKLKVSKATVQSVLEEFLEEQVIFTTRRTRVYIWILLLSRQNILYIHYPVQSLFCCSMVCVLSSKILKIRYLSCTVITSRAVNQLWQHVKRNILSVKCDRAGVMWKLKGQTG